MINNFNFWYMRNYPALGNKLQQHVAAILCSDKSLRVYWRIFVKIFVAATEFVTATRRTDSV